MLEKNYTFDYNAPPALMQRAGSSRKLSTFGESFNFESMQAKKAANTFKIEHYNGYEESKVCFKYQKNNVAEWIDN